MLFYLTLRAQFDEQIKEQVHQNQCNPAQTRLEIKRRTHLWNALAKDIFDNNAREFQDIKKFNPVILLAYWKAGHQIRQRMLITGMISK